MSNPSGEIWQNHGAMLNDLLMRFAEADTLEDEDAISAELREVAKTDAERFIDAVRRLTVGESSALVYGYEVLSEEPGIGEHSSWMSWTVCSESAAPVASRALSFLLW
jgi:hypothetical protein